MNLIKQKLKRIVTLMLAVILSAVTLPCWAKAEEAVPVYSVSVARVDGGTLCFVMDGQKAVFEEVGGLKLDFREGEKVMLKAEPDEGFTFAGCRVVSGENGYEKHYGNDEEITFDMPGHDVLVTASFEKIPEEAEQPQEPETDDDLSKEPYTETAVSIQENKTSDKKAAEAVRSVGDTSDFWADPNWGEGDVLFYGNINGKTTPAYCIDHGSDVPYSYYTQINPVFYANQLGYVMKHGYPNENWGLSAAEAQYLTQAAVYGVIGVDLWNIESGMQPPSFIYNALWGNGNFSIATNLVAQAQANATSADAAYVNYWYPTGNPSSQRMITPLPYVPEGYLNIVKSTTKKTADIRLVKESAIPDVTSGNSNYSLQGAQYEIYRDAACTEAVGMMTTDAEGVAEYKGLDLKKYYVKEIKASKGYRLSSEVMEYDLSSFESSYALDAVYTVNGNGKTYTLTCNASTGKSNTLTLEEGTYTITESTAAKGTIRNTGSYKATIASEKTTTVTTDIAVNAPEVFTMEKTVKEEPLMIPVSLLLKKVDAATGKQIPEGDAKLSDARFSVKYYTGTFTKASEEPSAATRSWLFRTDVKGEVRYTDSSAYFVSGDTVYKNAAGVPALPIGTVTVRETEAPEGYNMDESETIMTVSLTETDGKIEADLTFHDEEGNVRGTQSMTVGNTATNIIIQKNETVRLGGLSVQKLDNDKNKAEESGDASLSGIRFAVVNRSDNAVRVNGSDYAAGEVVMILVSDEKGFARTAEDELPYGTYQVCELRLDAGIETGDVYDESKKLGASAYANESYMWDDWSDTQEIHEEGMIVEYTVSNTPAKGGLKVRKIDSEREESMPQGDATFKDAEFTIYNNSKESVFVENKEYQPGEAVKTITVPDDEGITETAEDLLPYGTYYVKETKAPEGYLLNEDWQAVFRIREEGVIVDLTEDPVPDTPVRGGVSIQKVSKETGLSYAQGGGTLEGAEITIYNGSIYSVLVNGQEYEPGEAVLTLVTDENGFAQSGEKDLPYGSYHVKETKNPEGYLLNNDWQADFRIREDGVVVDLTENPVDDQVGRRGFEFKKTIDGKERVANCLFEVTMTATGETHYILTDPNGVYNSRKFEANNKNDGAVMKNEDGTYSIDESRLSYENNAWFSMDSEGNVVDPIEGYDAFVYGEYLFTEIRTSANANLDLISFHAYVYEDGFYLSEDGDIYDLGTKDDKEITIKTTASDAEDGDKVVSKTGEVRIEDCVEYANLTKGKEYTLEGKLFNKTTGAFMKDAEGNEITAFVTFTAAASSGSVIVAVVFDGVLLEEAKEIVVFESLYEKGQLLVVHNNPNDEGQTLTVEEPQIPEKPKTPDYPKTGDASHILFWAFLTFGAALAAVGISIYYSKKKKEKGKQ